MHELSITENLIKTCLREANEKKASKIIKIKIKTGAFSGIVPECIQMYLDMLSEGTIAEGAVIESETLPVKILCRECGAESEVTYKNPLCSNCKSKNFQILSGNEFIIDNIEIE